MDGPARCVDVAGIREQLRAAFHVPAGSAAAEELSTLAFGRMLASAALDAALGTPEHREVPRRVAREPFDAWSARIGGDLASAHVPVIAGDGVEVDGGRLDDCSDALQALVRKRGLDAAAAVLAEHVQAAAHQRPTGTYYTPADVTAYIGETCIIGAFLDGLADLGVPVGDLLRRALPADPQRCLPPTVTAGVQLPLPPAVAAGIDNPSQRAPWSAPAAEGHGLPGESWRDCVARRSWAADRMTMLTEGRVGDVDSCISLTLRMTEVARAVLGELRHPAAASCAVDALAGLRVLDPTCGSGAFLLAAARVLRGLRDDVARCAAAAGIDRAEVDRKLAHVPLGCLHGTDIDAAAVEACRFGLALESVSNGAACDGGQPASVRQVAAALRQQVQVADCAAAVDWAARFPRHAGAFHVVLGNPPYVREASSSPRAEGLHTRACGNLYAWVTERAFAALRPGGRVGLVVPVSSICTDALEPYRELWDARACEVWVSSFDAIPCTLFPGTVQRLSIMLGRGRAKGGGSGEPAASWQVTRYHKWRAEQRDALLPGLRYVKLPSRRHLGGSVAKIGTPVERELLERLSSHPPLAALLSSVPRPVNRVWYKRRWSYFLFFVDFMPEIYDAHGQRREPSEFRCVDVDPGLDARVVLAALNSSLFYWYFTVFSDNRNVNQREIRAFPFGRPAPALASELVELAEELMCELRRNSELRTCTYRSIGTIRNQYFFQGATKPVLDRIDAVLARHYGFDEAQLDMLVSFDQAFRAGAARPPRGAVSASGR